MAIQLKTTPTEVALFAFRMERETDPTVTVPATTLAHLIADAHAAHELLALVSIRKTGRVQAIAQQQRALAEGTTGREMLVPVNSGDLLELLDAFDAIPSTASFGCGDSIETSEREAQ